MTNRKGHRALRWSALIAVATMSGACGARKDSVATPPQQDEYVVQEGNQLQIAVWPTSDLGLSGEYAVEDGGRVYLPLLGGVDVGGKSLSEVRAVLRSNYGETLKEPVIQITPIFPVSVLGAVNRPGLYRVTPAETLFDVISLAGGFAGSAKEDELRILRGEQVIEVNAAESFASTADLTLQSGDRIVVPRGWNIGIRDVLWVLQSVGLIISLSNRI